MTQPVSSPGQRRKRGATLVISAVLLIVLAGVTGLVVDVGFLKVTRTQLQAADDSSALSAVAELPAALTLGATETQAQAASSARTVAVQYAALERNGNVSTTYCDPNRDVEVGNAILTGGTWKIQPNVAPYNMVRVTLHRDQAGSTNNDAPLPLFFAGALGRKSANLECKATAAVLAGSTFKIAAGSTLTASILPFAMDQATWNTIAGGTAPDNYKYDPTTGAITAGQSDGIREVDLYPSGTGASGNRGIVQIGIGNGASAISDQIQNGVTASELSSFGGQLTATASQPLLLSGTPGLKASLKGALSSIIGQPRTIALYTNVSGNGSNTTYTIVEFVPVRLLSVQLTGNNKHVWVQPAVVVDPTVVPDPTQTITTDSVFSTPTLIQ